MASVTDLVESLNAFLSRAKCRPVWLRDQGPLLELISISTFWSGRSGLRSTDRIIMNVLTNDQVCLTLAYSRVTLSDVISVRFCDGAGPSSY